jgi:hypothetical protein
MRPTTRSARAADVRRPARVAGPRREAPALGVTPTGPCCPEKPEILLWYIRSHHLTTVRGASDRGLTARRLSCATRAGSRDRDSSASSSRSRVGRAGDWFVAYLVWRRAGRTRRPPRVVRGCRRPGRRGAGRRHRGALPRERHRTVPRGGATAAPRRRGGSRPRFRCRMQCIHQGGSCSDPASSLGVASRRRAPPQVGYIEVASLEALW